MIIPAAEVVRGDILELEAGEAVPADGRLLESNYLQCIEAALTGESAPVLKETSILKEDVALADRENMIFMGTNIVGGIGRAVVVCTGMNTEVGQIAKFIEAAGEEETPLQKRLESFGRVLVWACLGIIALLFLLGWARGVRLFELFMTSVSLAVAAVPEGLPAVVTMALALGVMRMAGRGALVRRLPAVETLGCTTVICTDKTGTLTVGEMTIRELYVAGSKFVVTGEGYGPQGEVLLEGKAAQGRLAGPLLELANILIGCNNAHLALKDGKWEVIGDPTEGHCLQWATKSGAIGKSWRNDSPDIMNFHLIRSGNGELSLGSCRAKNSGLLLMERRTCF
jgi:Ca2+-transporting ATPase